MADVWARLRCCVGCLTAGGKENELVECRNSPFSVGRAKDCDLRVTSSKCVSSRHCRLVHEPVSHKTTLEDISTNGTLLNGVKLTKGNPVAIKTSDIIALVQKVEDPSQNVALQFTLEMEPGDTADEESTESCTQEANLDTGGEFTDSCKPEVTTDLSSGGQKRKAGDDLADIAPDSKRSGTGDASKGEGKTAASEAMLETLTCGICQDILHDCVSLQPCLHAFCAGCYCPWMARSKRCPQCRKRAVAVSKNHIVNNLAQCFLAQYPDYKRDAADLAELDAKNTIKEETLQVSKRASRADSDDDDEDEDDDSEGDYDPSESDSDSSGSNQYVAPVSRTQFGFGPLPLPRVNAFGGYHGFGAPFPGPALAARCRQCPGYSGPHPILPTPQSTAVPDTGSCEKTSISASASTVTAPVACSDPSPAQPTGVAASKAPPSYACTGFTPHLMCQCCRLPMPDRRRETQQPPVPRQECELCKGFFCHLYWSCKGNPACAGCLSEFCNLNVTDAQLVQLVNKNSVESKVLQDHLKANAQNAKDLVAACVKKLRDGAYFTQDSAAGRLQPETTVCFRCGYRNLAELAFQFRREIPTKDLPVEIRNRPDCHWGRECRTQWNKPHHAERFNHACERTKFD